MLVRNDKWIKALGEGDVELNCEVNGKTNNITLKDVLHIPDMASLFSAGQAAKAGEVSVFGKGGCKIYQGKNLVATGKFDLRNKLFYLEAEVIQDSFNFTTQRTVQDWHSAMDHADIHTITKMIENKAVEGMEVSKPINHQCGDCAIGKGTKSSHQTAQKISRTKPKFSHCQRIWSTERDHQRLLKCLDSHPHHLLGDRLLRLWL